MEKFAAQLWRAEKECSPLVRFTKDHSNFSLSQGYGVQAMLKQFHVDSGARIVGRKMGMTSRAKMLQMKIDAPIHGFLTDRMEVQSGAELSLNQRIQAKVEPEIVFVTSKDLRGKPSAASVWGAVEAIGAGLEIIDSRYVDYDFQLPDVVADNCSSAAFVVGPGLKSARRVLRADNLGIRLDINGEAVQFGSSAAILGDPIRSLVALVALLEEEGDFLPAGSVVLAGGATAAVSLKSGLSVRAEFEELGKVEFTTGA